MAIAQLRTIRRLRGILKSEMASGIPLNPTLLNKEDRRLYILALKVNISNLIQKLSEISEQNAATAQELNATTDRVNDNVELLSENGGSVSRSAEDLESIIARFKVDNNPFISEGTNDTSLEETTE